MLREQIDLDGIPVHVADTAGIRETNDLIEAEGVRRARQVLQTADIILLIEDARHILAGEEGLLEELAPNTTCIIVANKTDLLAPLELAAIDQESKAGHVWISAKTGQGLDILRHKIREAVGATDRAEGSFSARQRHVDAIKRANNHLLAGQQVMEESAAGELLAEELRLAHRALGEITGEMLPDDLLGEIFSSFCIGK